MSELGENQEELKAALRKRAIGWGVFAGLVAALIAYFALGGLEGMSRWLGTAVIGAGAGAGIFRWNFSSASKDAKCASCGAAYSITQTDRQEELVSSEEKSETTENDDGSVELRTWVSDTFDVTDTYTCSSCGNQETKTYQVTRSRDEETKVKPPKTAKGKLGKAEDDGQTSHAGADDTPAEKPSRGLGRAD